MFPLPGITRLPSHQIEFPLDGAGVCESFADHWVSNVYDREQVLKVFEDTLGFQPKVNFNWGVVGAGEAVIESTVAGNDAWEIFESESDFFKSQDQIFLPINNPLSPHGHVHQYLEELGQGVQHMACRVQDLPLFIHRANRYRQVTGEGLSFLNIPRSYYGYLQHKHFLQLDEMEFKSMIGTLEAAELIDRGGVVKFDLKRDEAWAVLKAWRPDISDTELKHLAELVLQGRYSNMTDLLGDRFTEDEYLTIIENQILVDIQGHDALLQIFTNPLMLTEQGQQWPFLEFIQRVCDKNAIEMKPGCGGFGIRNFLTLFLSIEVSNFMDILEKWTRWGDTWKAEQAKKWIDIFTNQMNWSNPVLTEISDVMTYQSEMLDQLNMINGLLNKTLTTVTPSIQDQVMFYQNMNNKELELQKAEKIAIIEEQEEKKLEIQERLKNIGESHKMQMRELMAVVPA